MACSCRAPSKRHPPKQASVENALAPDQQYDNQESAERGEPPVGKRAKLLRQQHQKRRSNQRARSDRRSAKNDSQNKIDRSLEAEIAGFDINMMMGEKAARDRRNRGAQSE